MTSIIVAGPNISGAAGGDLAGTYPNPKVGGAAATRTIIPADTNGTAQLIISNPNAGNAAVAQFLVGSDVGFTGVGTASSAVNNGLVTPNTGYVLATAGPLLVYSSGAFDVIFATGGSGAANERMRLDHANTRLTLKAIGLLLNNGSKAGGSDVGAHLYSGTGAPNNANGNNGDFYFRVDGAALSTIYQKRAGAWAGIV